MSTAASAVEEQVLFPHCALQHLVCFCEKKKAVCDWALPGKDRGLLGRRIIQDGRDL